MSLILVASALGAAAPPATASSTIVVCTDAATCAHTSIQTAINAAADGDTIVVRPGTYSGALHVDRDVTICSTLDAGTTCSSNPNEVTIDGAGDIYPVFIAADGVTIRGFTIQNPTYVTTDQSAGGKVDPSLVVVYGADDVTIIANILQFPASPLAAASSRWITDGVNVAADQSTTPGDLADNVAIYGNIFRHFVEAVGPDGTCANAPCRMAAIDLWGAGPSASIEWNNMLLPPGRVDHTSPQVVGVWGNAQDALLRENFIQPVGDVVAGFYGVKGTYQNSVFRDNSFYGNLHGLFVAGSDLTIEDNHFQQNNEGLRITAKDSTITGNEFFLNNIGVRVASPNGLPEATDLVFRENHFADNTRDFSVHAQVSNVAFDLRENDWGVYERDQIELFLEDLGTGNTLDISCFIDEDGTTRVCPVASFTTTVTGTSWPRTVTLTDTSVTPGSELDSRTWTLPGGASSSAGVVTLSLMPNGYTFDLSVTDGEGFTDTASDTLILVNTPPTFDVATNHAAVESTAFSLPLGAVDGESDTLSYTLVGAPAGVAIVDGTLEWTPTHAQAGSHSFSIDVSDGVATTSDSVSIVVTDVPVGAVIDPVAPLNLLEGGSGSRNVQATSPAGSPIVLAMVSGPAGASFVDSGNGQGTFSYTAPAGSSGTYGVTIEATSEGITTSTTFNVVVTSAVGVGFARQTPTTQQTSPGATVQLTGIVKNLGTGSDAFRVTAVSQKGGWALVTPADIPLAAGAAAPATVTVSVPANGDASSITVKVCSVASPTTCQQLAWRVEVPLVVTVHMASSFSPLDQVGGTVTVKFLNGAAADAQVIVTETSDENLPLFESSDSGATDPFGDFTFVLEDVRANFLGGHSVFVSVKRGDVMAVKTAHYDVEP